MTSIKFLTIIKNNLIISPKSQKSYEKGRNTGNKHSKKAL